MEAEIIGDLTKSINKSAKMLNSKQLYTGC